MKFHLQAFHADCQIVGNLCASTPVLKQGKSSSLSTPSQLAPRLRQGWLREVISSSGSPDVCWLLSSCCFLSFGRCSASPQLLSLEKPFQIKIFHQLPGDGEGSKCVRISCTCSCVGRRRLLVSGYPGFTPHLQGDPQISLFSPKPQPWESASLPVAPGTDSHGFMVGLS